MGGKEQLVDGEMLSKKQIPWTGITEQTDMISTAQTAGPNSSTANGSPATEKSKSSTFGRSTSHTSVPAIHLQTPSSFWRKLRHFISFAESFAFCSSLSKSLLHPGYLPRPRTPLSIDPRSTSTTLMDRSLFQWPEDFQPATAI